MTGLGDVIVIGLLVAAVVLAIHAVRKNQKKGGCSGCLGSCSGSCSRCSEKK